VLSRRIALWTASLALAAVIGLVLFRPAGVVSFPVSRSFARLAPEAPPGWEARDAPLGATELAAGEAAQSLNFDAFFSKVYRRGAMEVRVYAAYWTPGREDPSLVEGHIPDVCWVGAGGVVVGRDDARIVHGPGGRDSIPARFRVFEFTLRREEVVFWHLIGRRQVGLADQVSSPVLGRLHRFGQILRITSFGLSPQEQVFVRISTNRTVDELVMSDLWPAFGPLLREGGILGPGGSGAPRDRTAPSP
jgi:hypothetical protein